MFGLNKNLNRIFLSSAICGSLIFSGQENSYSQKNIMDSSVVKADTIHTNKSPFKDFTKSFLDMEKEIGFDVRNSDYMRLDSLINSAKRYLLIDPRTQNEKEKIFALQNLSSIDMVLFDYGFRHSDENLNFCTALRERKFNSFQYVSFYLDIAEKKNIPIESKKIGNHYFIKYNLNNSAFFYWDAVMGCEQKDSFYKKFTKEQNNEIKDLDSSHIYSMKYLDKGLTFLKRKKYLESIQSFENSTSFDGFNIYAYKYLGDANRDFKDYARAISDYTLAIGLNPSFSEAYFERAELFLRLKNFKKALEDYNKIIELNPSCPGWVYQIRAKLISRLDETKGSIWDEKKIPKQSEKDYQKALEKILSGNSK